MGESNEFGQTSMIESIVEDRAKDTIPLIAHIIFRLDIGGLENGLVNLINNLPEGGYRHVIICLKDYTEFRFRIYRKDISVFALNKADGKDVQIYVRLWRLLRELKPDIVHTRNLAALDCQFIATLAGVRARVHGEHGWDMVDLHGSNLKYNLLRRLCRPLIKRYIPLSRDLEYWLRHKVAVPKHKIYRIYNGVDTLRFYPATEGRWALPETQFTHPDTFVIGTVGRMHAVKDQLTLVRAFIHLRQFSPEIGTQLRLVLVGDGPLREQARGLLSHAGATDMVWLAGSRDDVPEIMRGFDVFVLPSLNEGISNTILEAMSCGIPVVATRVGGNPELVMEGQTGILVPPSNPKAMAEALLSYFNDKPMRQSHGQAGHNRVKREFSLEAMVSHYMAVYDAVLGECKIRHRLRLAE